MSQAAGSPPATNAGRFILIGCGVIFALMVAITMMLAYIGNRVQDEIKAKQEVPVAVPPETLPEPPPPPEAPPPVAIIPAGPKPVPSGNPGAWVNAGDYPLQALREEYEGTTRFTLEVNAEGRVTGCLITESSGHAVLDAAACRNISRRARFRPATDAATGKPTSGTYSNSVRWQIPKD